MSCQTKLLNHLSSKTTLQVKCFRRKKIVKMCVGFSLVMICLLALIYKSHSVIAFHGAFAQRQLSDARRLETSQISDFSCCTDAYSGGIPSARVG